MSGYAVKKDLSGWRSVDGEFADATDATKSYPDSETEMYSATEPPAPIQLPPTLEAALAAASAERDRLLSIAALRIAPLQDAADLNDATATDVANLKLWKQYRVAVNRAPSQAGSPTTIDWPSQPGDQ